MAVVEAVLAHWPDLRHAPPRTLIRPGPQDGALGGEIARQLAALGWAVTVGAPDAPPELVIDVGGGTGGDWPDARRVAVDGPAGLDLDTGRRDGPWVRADLTVALQAARPGHFLADGPEATGALHIVDLCLPVTAALRLCDPNLAAIAKTGGHKFDYGHALVLSGAAGHGGAARMAARAALRIGAGLVTLLPPRDALPEHAARLDAIMLRGVEGAADLSALLEDPRANALCLGPGLGVARAAALLPAALGADRATVLDADALTALAQTDLAGLHPHCVLTPHPGEFRRLFPDLADAPLAKPDAVRQAAARAGCTVLLKGHDTVIADPSGRAVLAHASHDRAAPWLATAGAGDVLSGMIAGLLARGLPPFDAAATAAWLHVEVARDFGPGLIAEDLPDRLPAVFRKLGL
ncbi:NAD(P)H-hydrate dehydratase [Falsirhodobacter algicola]|nr:NAD(P)H-hydrate dehydratase [Falsirhodobacter algicola]